MRSGKLLGLAACAAMLLASRAMALDLSEWSSIQMPPPPELKPATVDPKTTALFLFDFMTENCGDPNRFTYCRRYLIISYVQFWGLYVTTFQLAVPKGPKIKLPEPRGAPPHGTPRLA